MAGKCCDVEGCPNTMKRRKNMLFITLPADRNGHSNWLIKTLRGLDKMKQVQTVCEDHIDPYFLRIIRQRNILYGGESKKENGSDKTNEPQPGPSGSTNEDITDKSVPGADSSREQKKKVSKFKARKRKNTAAIKSEPVDEEPGTIMEKSDETSAPEFDVTQEIAETCAKRARVDVDAQEETADITTEHIINSELIIKEDPDAIEGEVTPPVIYDDIALKQVKPEHVKVNVKQEISEIDTPENVDYHDSLGYQNLPNSANDSDTDSIDNLIKSELKTDAQVNEGPLEISDKKKSERQTVPSLTNVLEYLLKENYINITEYDMLAKYKSEFHLLHDRNECLDPKLIYFAIALYVCSHKAYEYICNNYKTALLPASSLRDRMVNLRGHPGFTRETLEAINDMTAKRNSNTYVCLVLKDVKVISKGATSKFRSSNPLEWSIGSADAAVVFTAVALNANWKLPFGYFWTNSIKGIERANLVKVAIGILETVGVEPVAVSFEYNDENIKMCAQLDCTIDKIDSTTFFFSESNKPIYIFPDPRDILDVIYTDISIDDEFIDVADKVVSVAQLPQIMEHLKTVPPDQLLKKVVASELVKNALSTFDPSSEYRIIIFLKYLHIVLDILACWKRGLKWKATPNSKTAEGGTMWVTALREANQYFKSLKLAQTMIPLCETDKGRGLLALCALIDSALMFIFKYSHKFPIEFRKFVGDPSYFLANLTSRYNRTTPVSFQRAYRNMLKNISYWRYEQCLGIEDVHLLRKKPVDKINLTTFLPNGNTVWYVKDDFWKLNLGHEMVKEYADEFMMYIARFVTYCLARQLHCETCIRAIRAEKANTKKISSSKYASRNPQKINALRLRKFIEKLEHPSPTVIDICKHSESIFRKASNLKEHSKQNIHFQLIKVMKRYVNRPLFENIIDHQLDTYETCNHLVELAKAVAKLYLETRVYHSEMALARESAISNQRSKPTAGCQMKSIATS